jgi:hypothetical protein
MGDDWVTWRDLVEMAKRLRKTKEDPVLLEKLEGVIIELGHGKELEEEKGEQ